MAARKVNVTTRIQGKDEISEVFTLGVVAWAKLVTTGVRAWSGFKLKRMFKTLEAVEKGHAAGRDCAKLLGDLDVLDRDSAAMFVPMSTVQDYVDFRQFLHDMRERVG